MRMKWKERNLEWTTKTIIIEVKWVGYLIAEQTKNATFNKEKLTTRLNSHKPGFALGNSFQCECIH